jgi:hypothetical protein
MDLNEVTERIIGAAIKRLSAVISALSAFSAVNARGGS